MRYLAVEDSLSGHCCFEATVVDTHTEHPALANQPGAWVCECYNIVQARQIAEALNLLNVIEKDIEDAASPDLLDDELIDELCEEFDPDGDWGGDPGAYDGWQDDH